MVLYKLEANQGANVHMLIAVRYSVIKLTVVPILVPEGSILVSQWWERVWLRWEITVIHHAMVDYFY